MFNAGTHDNTQDENRAETSNTDPPDGGTVETAFR